MHSVEALGNATEDGVASVACWFSAEDFLRTEAIYSVRLPFQANWDAVERATAVFSFLRAVGRGYDNQVQQHRAHEVDGKNGSSGLALLPALRSRYTQLYTSAFRTSTMKRNEPEQLCGSLHPPSAVDSAGKVQNADYKIFADSGKLAQMQQKVGDVVHLLRQQHPPAVAALNFANFGESSFPVVLHITTFY